MQTSPVLPAMKSDYSGAAVLYDAIYRAAGKDYAKEAGSVTEVIRSVSPHSRELLEVACGSGEHAKYFSQCFQVTGIDFSPGMIALAKAKVPSGSFVQGRMQSFDLGRTFDAIVCLFSSIGHTNGTPELDATLRAFRRHVVDDGVVVVEPWFSPEAWQDGYNGPALPFVTDDGARWERHITTKRDGRFSRLYFEFREITGTRVIHEELTLYLYTRDEMEAAFEKAGFSVQFDERGLTGRGLYIARPVRR